MIIIIDNSSLYTLLRRIFFYTSELFKCKNLVSNFFGTKVYHRLLNVKLS